MLFKKILFKHTYIFIVFYIFFSFWKGISEYPEEYLYLYKVKSLEFVIELL